jgi:methylmalonyl-CoA mutase cobalamin-binding domain/chain
VKTDNILRILTAVPICDGHDSAITTVNLELVRHGIEVVYLGYHRSARDIVRAAIQEDVRAIGISSYNGGHVEFFTELVRRLRRQGAAHIGVFGGGGATISPADARRMKRNGVDEIFFAGTPLADMVEFVRAKYGRARRVAASPGLPTTQNPKPGTRCRVVGLTGPGGAGKTTLMDELVLRWLTKNPRSRIGILSHDPSRAGHGALLGDRAAMIYSQHNRVFMRSLATRGQPGGLAPQTGAWRKRFQQAGFDVVFVETVGTGQEAMPFTRHRVDTAVLVLSPDYGARLQLQKIAMLDVADIVVVNKADAPGARTARAELQQRLARNRHEQKLLLTVAKRHRDPGVDELFDLLQRRD